MAFLDNSGDIILGAVLTDVGRRRMAQGNFRITKFAFGDDEIDYGTYNPNHPSGSAYADLEILQTPILEAFTQQNANINYGLVSYSRNDLLYLPSIALNRKMGSQMAAITGDQNVIYLADTSKFSGTSNTYTLLIDGTRATETAVMATGEPTKRFIFVETGINNEEVTPTAANQATYLTNVGLTDRQFVVGYDNRFLNAVFGPAGETAVQFSSPSAAASSATLTAEFASPTANAAARNLSNYSEVVVLGNMSKLYAPSAGADNTSTFSEFTGPRSSLTAVGLGMRDDLNTDHYTRYGSINQDIFGLSDGITFDYIDTMIYIKGITTNVTLQVPIRITRVSS